MNKYYCVGIGMTLLIPGITWTMEPQDNNKKRKAPEELVSAENKKRRLSEVPIQLKLPKTGQENDDVIDTNEAVLSLSPTLRNHLQEVRDGGVNVQEEGLKITDLNLNISRNTMSRVIKVLQDMYNRSAAMGYSRNSTLQDCLSRPGNEDMARWHSYLATHMAADQEFRRAIQALDLQLFTRFIVDIAHEHKTTGTPSRLNVLNDVRPCISAYLGSDPALDPIKQYVVDQSKNRYTHMLSHNLNIEDFSPDLKRAVKMRIKGAEHVIEGFDLEHNELWQERCTNTSNVVIQWSKDSQYCAWHFENNMLCIYDWKRKTTQYFDNVITFVISKNAEPHVLIWRTGSSLEKYEIWNLSKNICSSAGTIPLDNVHTLSLSEYNNYLTLFNDSTIKIMNLQTGAVVIDYSVVGEKPAMGLSFDEHYCYFFNQQEKKLMIWNMQGTLVLERTIPDLTGLHWLLEDKLFIARSSDIKNFTVEIIAINTQKVVYAVDNAVDVTREPAFLVVPKQDGLLDVVDKKTGERVFATTKKVNKFLTDCTTHIVLQYEKHIEKWDLVAKKLLVTLPFSNDHHIYGMLHNGNILLYAKNIDIPHFISLQKHKTGIEFSLPRNTLMQFTKSVDSHFVISSFISIGLVTNIWDLDLLMRFADYCTNHISPEIYSILIALEKARQDKDHAQPYVLNDYQQSLLNDLGDIGALIRDAYKDVIAPMSNNTIN